MLKKYPEASHSGRGGTACRDGEGNMIYKNNKLLENAKELRRNMTRQEKHLWYDFLKTYPIKIYKQRIIGNYIVDFYCSAINLVIEIDGSQHYMDKGIIKDKIRDNFLKENNLKVLRFSNLDIDRNFKEVCMTIDAYIKGEIK